MLRIHQLVKNYYQQKAVDQVSFEVRKGSIFGLLGPNGAGKSSLLRMITGITLPDEGEVYFNNELFDAATHMQQIGYMPEERGLYKKMKVREHLVYLGQLKGLSKVLVNEHIDYWFERLDMQSWSNKKVEDLSKGMSQKLQFVATVLHKPQLLILDEPFSGLDPVNAKIIKDEIFHLAESGTTIIFSTHRMEQVEEVCEDIVLLDNGRLILVGSVHEIKQQFKKNQFALATTNEVLDLPFEVVSHEQNMYILQLNEGQHSRDILSFMLKHQLEVLHFSEVLPSLNQIFISLVKNSAARQFQTTKAS